MAIPSRTYSRTLRIWTDLAAKFSTYHSPSFKYLHHRKAKSPLHFFLSTWTHCCSKHTSTNNNINHITRRYYFHRTPLSDGVNIVSERNTICSEFNASEACERIRSLRDMGHPNRDIQLLIDAVTKELLWNHRLDDVIQLLQGLIQDQQQGWSRHVCMKDLLTKAYAKVFQLFTEYTAEIGEDEDASSFIEFLGVFGNGVSNTEFYQLLRVASQIGDSDLAIVCYERLKSSAQYVPCCGIAYGLLLQAHLNEVATGARQDRSVGGVWSEHGGNKDVLSTSLDEIMSNIPQSNAEQYPNDDFIMNLGKESQKFLDSSFSVPLGCNSSGDSPSDDLLMRLGNQFQEYGEARKDEPMNSYALHQLHTMSLVEQEKTLSSVQHAYAYAKERKVTPSYGSHLDQELVEQYIKGVSAKPNVTEECSNGISQKDIAVEKEMIKAPSPPPPTGEGGASDRALCPGCGKTFKELQKNDKLPIKAMIRTPYAMAVNHQTKPANGQPGNDVWDELRRAARPLENELEMKLVSFSKLGTGQHKRLNKSEEKEALLGANNSDHMFETMSMEIERLLTKLTEVNDRMGEHLGNMGFGEPNPAQLHTMQRHRDILQDYSHEFVKTKANIKATKDREELLGSVQRDISDYKSGLSRRTDLYLKENEHLRNSERLADETIEIAMNTKENLSSQRKMFSSLSGRIANVASMFPSINNLVQKINVRKRRDALILGGVISVCLIIMLMYMFK